MKTFPMILCLVLVRSEERGFKLPKHMFWRNMDREGIDGRRVFGGEPAELMEYPTAAALLDRYWNIRCSSAVIAPRWTLTAAHCVTTRVAYVIYNTRTPVPAKGMYTPVLYLYRHPNYKVVQEDEGEGMDVTLLHHDLGLVRTRDDIKLNIPIPPLVAIRKYSPEVLANKEATVVGFGRTEVAPRSAGEELFAVKLKMVYCDRGAWFHCMCGLAPSGNQRGVCSGDSGGPLIYDGVQVGVTSMGPLECATRSGPTDGAMSVFTSLYKYVDLINATILDTESTIAEKFSKYADNNAKLTYPSIISIALISVKTFAFLT